MSASKFATYDQIGQVEDVSDIISDITPTEVPFQTSVRSGKTSAALVEWQEDSLGAVADNAHIEGADAPAAVQTATTMRSNRLQLFMKTAKVTGKAQAIKLYGRADELAYQMGKMGKEIKRDLERALVGVSQAAVAGADGVTASRFQSTFSSVASANETDASGAALTETMVLDVMNKVYTSGGEVTTALIKPASALHVANFAYRDGGATFAAQRGRQVNGTEITNVVDVYKSPWGRVTFKMDRFILSTAALFYDPEMWTILWLRKWSKEKLAKTGDADNYMLLGECTLKNHNFAASGKITAIL